MNKKKMLCMSLVALGLLAACGEKEVKQGRMVVPKPAEEQPVGTQQVAEQVLSQTIDWLGKTYVVTFSREADRTRPLVDDGMGVQYYDNAIHVRIDRQDGTTFFSQTYTKDNFARFSSAETLKRRTLYNISVYKQTPQALSLLACVSVPDESSDDYQLLEIAIDPAGNTNIQEVVVPDKEVIEE